MRLSEKINGGSSSSFLKSLDESALTEARNPENDKINDIIKKSLQDPDFAAEHTNELKQNGITYKPGKDDHDYGWLVGENGRRLRVSSKHERDMGWDSDTNDLTSNYHYYNYNNAADYDYEDSNKDRADLSVKSYKQGKIDKAKAKRDINYLRQKASRKNASENTIAALSNAEYNLSHPVSITFKNRLEPSDDVDYKSFLNAKKHSDRDIPEEPKKDLKTGKYEYPKNKEIEHYKDLKFQRKSIDSDRQYNKDRYDRDMADAIERVKNTQDEYDRQNARLDAQEKEWKKNTDEIHNRIQAYRDRRATLNNKKNESALTESAEDIDTKMKALGFLIKDEREAIRGYNDVKAKLNDYKLDKDTQDLYKSKIDEIIKDEKHHIAILQGLKKGKDISDEDLEESVKVARKSIKEAEEDDDWKIPFTEKDAEYFNKFINPFAKAVVNEEGSLYIVSNGNEYINPPQKDLGVDNVLNVTNKFIDEVEKYCAEKYPNAKLNVNNTGTIYWMYRLIDESVESMKLSKEDLKKLIKSNRKLSEDENYYDPEAIKALIEAGFATDEDEAKEIINSGDYIFFPGVEDDDALGHAYVDLVGGLEGVSHPEKYFGYDRLGKDLNENNNYTYVSNGVIVAF